MKYKLAGIWMFGLLAGTVMVNLFGEDAVREIGMFGGMFARKLQSETVEYTKLFLMVAQQRFTVVLFLTVISFTLFGIPVLYLFFLFSSFSVGAMIAGTTMSGGISGIFLFAASMLPQILIYLPAWLLLIEWCLRQHEYLFTGNGNGSMTLKQFLPQVPLLACTYALFLAGICVETFLNPPVVRFIWKIAESL